MTVRCAQSVRLPAQLAAILSSESQDPLVATLEAFLADAAIGSGYTVEVVTMAEAEVDELPEFAGW